MIIDSGVLAYDLIPAAFFSKHVAHDLCQSSERALTRTSVSASPEKMSLVDDNVPG